MSGSGALRRRPAPETACTACGHGSRRARILDYQNQIADRHRDRRDSDGAQCDASELGGQKLQHPGPELLPYPPVFRGGGWRKTVRGDRPGRSMRKLRWCVLTVLARGWWNTGQGGETIPSGPTNRGQALSCRQPNRHRRPHGRNQQRQRPWNSPTLRARAASFSRRPGHMAIGGWCGAGSDEDEAIRKTSGRFDHGINLDRHARSTVGHSEEIGRQGAAGAKLRDSRVATKVGLDEEGWGNLSQRDAPAHSAEGDASELKSACQTEISTLYQVHWPDMKATHRGNGPRSCETCLNSARIGRDRREQFLRGADGRIPQNGAVARG